MIGKWARKAKYAQAGYETLTRMLTLAPTDFYYDSSRDNVFELLVDGLGDQELRRTCLDLLHALLRDTKLAVLKEDMERFTVLLKTLYKAAFPKNTDVVDSEAQVLVALLTEGGVKHIVYLMEVATLFLGPKSHMSVSQKVRTRTGVEVVALWLVVRLTLCFSPRQAVMLRALGKLARLETDKIQTYDYMLGPLVMPYIEDQEDPVLLRAAITCFPYIRHSNAASFQVPLVSGVGGGAPRVFREP